MSLERIEAEEALEDALSVSFDVPLCCNSSSERTKVGWVISVYAYFMLILPDF